MLNVQLIIKSFQPEPASSEVERLSLPLELSLADQYSIQLYARGITGLITYYFCKMSDMDMDFFQAPSVSFATYVSSRLQSTVQISARPALGNNQ